MSPLQDLPAIRARPLTRTTATVEALEFRRQVPRYLASRLVATAAPRLWSARLPPLYRVRLPWPGTDRPGWTTVGVRLSGICGSDLGMMTGRESLYLEPEATYPFVPGHEIVGEVDGSRVAVWPVLGCRARGLQLCPACTSGWEGMCSRRDTGWPGPGLAIGFNHDTGGGWSEACLAHLSQLWPIPGQVSDQDALFLDPASAALASLLRTQDFGGGRTLVIGGGTIGMLAAQLHRDLGLPGSCELLVRHEGQRRHAETIGLVASAAADESGFEAWGAERGISSRQVTAYGRVHHGVFQRVIDCAGSRQSFEWATAAVCPRGCVVLVTSPASLSRFDPTPLWYREVTIQGINQYGPVPWEGVDTHPYAVLLPRLADGTLRFRHHVTHQFPLERYVDAFRASSRRRESRAVKVAFRISTVA